MTKKNNYILVFILLVVTTLQAQHLKVGDSLFAMGFYNKAIANYSLSKENIKEFKIAKVHEANGDYVNALKNLENYITIDSLNTLVNFMYGKTLLQLKKSKEAIATFEKLTKENENPTYFYYLGLAYEQDIKIIDALKMFQKVIELDDFHLKSNYKVALFEMRADRWEKAMKIVDKIIAQQSQNTDFLSLKAQCLYGKSDFKNAKKTFEYLIELNFKEQFVYEKIALCLMKLNEYQKSIEAYESMMIQFEQIANPDFHYNIGLNYGYLKNLQLAEKHFMLSVELKTATFEKEYFSIALFNQENGNLNKALTFYKKTIQEQPEYLEAHYQIAIITDETSKDLAIKLKTFENLKAKFPDMSTEKLSYVDYRIKAIKKEIHLKG
ncbi:tetratricopeptide repeat protein [Flavobacterium lacus]|uniref:Tetratricopeptide repeat protein n=1 Tax=Flavobacterium lacus TaxID=1353778 RepID=A0A328X151_9FLAO|nr:tetratricopeptide repeat protein [Flavobacterium lacus]RAR50317.1 tetratricopeptide repeat protein [Flavobacterium lacus]